MGLIPFLSPISIVEQTAKSAKMKCKGDLREFLVTGRKLPSASEPHTPIYRVRLFAPDPICAKSRFWYFVSYYKKVNKTAGEIISVKKVSEKSPTVVKNFGIWVDTTRDRERTTCTVNPGTRKPPAPSPSATGTWEPAIVRDPGQSKSSRSPELRDPPLSAHKHSRC